ncbi:hypothetical protein QJS10_CPB14g00926 [Acorus calamus]|uniref:TOD1/MUCI70 glycosyltransferase-like domain-containing protein n=1 Tax=Acorus calamus TaxID=4465 RepID=A0AAV9DEZ7_ACOCL|nr:hypothetical protein QJS10_CPB14g00926 [Acorus calamus]
MASKPPLLFQSKVLCFSLLYLFSSLFFSLYISFSQTKCLFNSPPPDYVLFSYPTSYGEHKHAIPATRSSCSSPVSFTDYEVVLEEIRVLCGNSTDFGVGLRYLEDGGQSFGGGFSTQERKSFFDKSDEVPCGFFTEFPIRDSDRLAMESCKGMVVVSAIFNNHDKIRQPKNLGVETLHTVCFFMFIDNSTLQDLQSHKIISNNPTPSSRPPKVGAWNIVTVRGKLPYDDPAMNGVIPKHLVHRLFPNARYSVWLDAKLQLTADPLLLVHSMVVSEGVDMAIAKHPFNVDVMEEMIATARWKKWGDVESLRVQMEAYCENGLQPWSHKKLPYTTDVPDTALIIRKHSTGSNRFSCLLFNELNAFNPRDQLAFAFVRDLMKPPIKINMFETETFEHVTIEFRHNLKHHNEGQAKSSNKMRWVNAPRDINGSSCEGYLLKLWG